MITLIRGIVRVIPGADDGLETFHLISLATTNPNLLKASPGSVYGWYIYNNNASIRKVAFHNLKVVPTAGADVFMSLIIPPNSGANAFSTQGIKFSVGIGITTTTGVADSDVTPVGANDLDINIYYK